MGDWLKSAAAIGQVAKVATAAFGALAAVGVLVEVAGGANWLAIVFAAVGVVGGLVAFGLGLAQVRADRRDARTALWREGDPRPLREALAGDGIYRLGAEVEAQAALSAAGLVDARHAPYIGRDVDEALRAQLVAGAQQPGATLVVLCGHGGPWRPQRQ
jgi:hypothetical protein